MTLLPTAQVLQVGTFHFGPSDDATQIDFDAGSGRRQREILEVTERLAEFEPTVVAVEAEPPERSRLNGRYRAFRDGRLEASVNEIEQLAFRLAARCGLGEIEPVDHQVDLPFDAVLDWAEKSDPGFVRQFWRQLRKREQADNMLVAESTLAKSLRHFNEPEVVARDHALYLTLARIRAGQRDVGADLLTAWYRRNIGIFAQSDALCPARRESPPDHRVGPSRDTS